VLLTFGLLGPGKGIEYAIQSLPAIVRTHPEVVYLILGATHPHLIAREGERYRLGRAMVWPEVARQYLDAFARARSDLPTPARRAFAGWTLGGRPYELPQLRLDHLRRMTDHTGIFQHAVFTVPNYHEGYCTDDNARAFLLCNLIGGEPELASRYLAFLAAAFQRPSGRFRNFMAHGKHWLEPWGSEECHGRALWALGIGASRSRDEGLRKLSVQLFDQALGPAAGFHSPRAWVNTYRPLRETRPPRRPVRPWRTSSVASGSPVPGICGPGSKTG